MLRYLCQACEQGMHGCCDGRHPPPPGMMGGSDCICKGDCGPPKPQEYLESDVPWFEALEHGGFVYSDDQDDDEKAVQDR